MYGYYIANTGLLVINKLLDIVFVMCRLLLTALAVILLLFVAGFLIVTCLSPGRLPMLYLAYISLIFPIVRFFLINGVLQGDLVLRPYGRILQYIVNAFVLVMPVFPLFSLICFWMIPDINHLPFQYFFSLVLYTLLLQGYTIGYSASFYRRGRPWLSMLRRTNIILGVTIICVCFLLFSPYSHYISENFHYKKDPVLTTQNFREVIRHEDSVAKKKEHMAKRYVQLGELGFLG